MMRVSHLQFPIGLMVAVFILVLPGCQSTAPFTIAGELKTWHTVTISFQGPRVSEQDLPNPFLGYRLIVEFTCEGDTFLVPGFFAADGDASETSTTEGDIWQVRFKPNREGTWSFRASFREGLNVSVSDDPNAGDPVAFDGMEGSFQVGSTDKTGRDFRAHGRLRYVNDRYLRFAGSGAYFIKGGADSPENFLAYHEFDGTRYGGNNTRRMGEDNPNADLHRYEPHIMDWNSGDPLWKGSKGKGIIGALNYLASEGMNSVYMLTMNVMGDGDDVWPWTDREERYRFDVSKLEQWEIVFSHMEQLGLMMHLVLQETENECLLDVGRLDVQRKLYLRELIARFGHHLAVTWNIGEENGPAPWTPVGQTVQDRKAMMSYIKKTHPYESFVVVHTHSSDPDHSRLIEPFLGFKDMDGPSLQLTPPSQVHDYTRKWINLSRDHGKPWVVCSDELGPHWTGVMPDADDPAHDTIRKEALWGNLMAGGAGVEWYFGYQYAHGDLNCEDWRSRDIMWDQTRHALEYFQNHLPFAKMTNQNEWVTDGMCLALPGELYSVYLPDGGTGMLDLSHTTGPFNVEWYDPRNGGALLQGTISEVTGGKAVSIGLPPADADQDWVCLIRAASL
jgi:hypothetical protein